MKRKISLLLLTVLLSCKTERTDHATPLSESVEGLQIAQKEVVCFVYHRFGDDRFPSTNVSIADFEAHLKWLTEHHYQVLNLSDAIDYLRSGKPTKKTAVITIDDGYKSFYKNGLPLLRKYNLPATLFINTETVGAGDYMDWNALKDASNKKIEIGNHTHSHPYFINESLDLRYKVFATEIQTSQKIIEAQLQLKPSVFAYPYGEFDDEMKAMIKAAGFKGAAAQNSGVIANSTDLYQLPRFPMSEAYAKIFEEKALMMAIKVIDTSPQSAVIAQGVSKPTLHLTIETKGLKVGQMQCFVQGSSCKMNILSSTDNVMQLSMEATTSITQRRRTLYTLTVPDSAGNWHWFSHLWINPYVK